MEQVNLQNLNSTAPVKNNRPFSAKIGKENTNFADKLKVELNRSPHPLLFSKHAAERLERRNIQVTDDMLKAMETAVDKVAAKGGKESVFLVDNVAMVVSIDNRTVITCVDTQNAQENIFTNIDSVAFL